MAVMVSIDREEKDMEFKMKEKVNFDSLVLKKKILGETLEIITNKTNYTITDLQFYLMISFVNALVEENVIVYCLADEDKLMDKLENVIEPLFNEHIKNNQELFYIYNELTDDLIDFMEREHENNLSVVGILNSMVEVLSGVDYQKIIDLISNTVEEKTPEKNDKKEKEIKPLTIEDAGIESEKMKALINQFAVNKNENTIQ